MRLRRSFYARDTLVVAGDLLGRRLVRILEGERLSGRIVEVEAYIGEEDQASHARSGATERNSSMYGPPGHAYVYLIYGLHHCFNVVTEQAGTPAAILIRALEPVEGLAVMRTRRRDRAGRQLTGGPARLCDALGIDIRFDGVDLCSPDTCLFLERGDPVPDDYVSTSPRINVRGDETARNVCWRFYVRDSAYVSR